jgi:outer membrane immunogenic protein
MRNSKWIVSAAVAISAIAGAASAADLSRAYTKAPAMPAPAPMTWTGCYVGVEGGYGWGREPVVNTSAGNTGATITTINPKGGLAGGTIGCNWQTSYVVFGIENDISWSGLRGTSGDLPPFSTTFSHSMNTTWLDTLRGRVGLAWNNVLFYGTAGAAFTRITDSAAGAGFAISGTTSRTGWTAGGGVEYMFAPNWSAKVEYLYADFGTLHDAFDVASGGTFVGANTHLTENIVRAGVNYHFNWMAR